MPRAIIGASLAAWAVLSVFLVAQASAEESHRLPNFKQLCVGEQAVGFDWKDGKWHRVVFEPDKYIVQKVSPPSVEEARSKNRWSEHSECTIADRHEGDYGDVAFYDSCIRITTLGDDLPYSELCSERHSRNGNSWTIDFKCQKKNFLFVKNGWFHRGHIHSDLGQKPNNDYKDSLVIEVGKCSDITD